MMVAERPTLPLYESPDCNNLAATGWAKELPMLPASRAIPAVAWEFVLDPIVRTWKWRELDGDGSMAQVSESLEALSIAIDDAIRHGFVPPAHVWSIDNVICVTYFE